MFFYSVSMDFVCTDGCLIATIYSFALFAISNTNKEKREDEEHDEKEEMEYDTLRHDSDVRTRSLDQFRVSVMMIALLQCNKSYGMLVTV